MTYSEAISASLRKSEIRTIEDLRLLEAQLKIALGEIAQILAQWKAVDTPTGAMMVSNSHAIRAEIEAIVKSVGDALTAAWSGTWQAWWAGGVEQVVGLGETLGVLYSTLIVDSLLLGLWDNLAPYHIQDVTKACMSQIGRQIRMSALAGQSQPEVFAAINALLMGDPSRHRQSRFGAFGYQVERIYRTESQRLFSMGQFEAAKTWNQRLDTDLVKIWRHQSTPNVMARDWHVRMHGQVRDVDDPFSNGLMYPRDPRGSGRETINCMCIMLTVPRETAQKMGLLKKRGE